jgi:hypothetical protein
VSVEAISWALNLAPVPVDRGGQPSSACKYLVGLANHAGPDGSCAFPSVATLVRYTGLSERTVRTCLDRLESERNLCSHGVQRLHPNRPRNRTWNHPPPRASARHSQPTRAALAEAWSVNSSPRSATAGG